MNRNELIKNLEYTKQKYENKFVSTGETNIYIMISDVLRYLNQPTTEINIDIDYYNELKVNADSGLRRKHRLSLWILVMMTVTGRFVQMWAMCVTRSILLSLLWAKIRLGGIRMDKKISIKKLNPVWRSMKTRCYSTKCKQYSNYGGRGISVCREWLESFDSFYKWAINNGWEEGLAIDRINNNGNYEPSNCRFVLPKENNAIGRRNYLNKNNSGYVGVTYHSQTCKWASRIGFEGRKINIGIYETIEDAVQARILKEIELFGEQKTNFHYHNKINSIEDTFIELKFYAMKQLNKEINEAELCGNESLKKELYAKTRCLENNFNLIFGKGYTENNDIDYQARVGRAALKIVGMYMFDDIEEMLRIAESEGE